MIESDGFKEKHRRNSNDFTRNRKLTFAVLIMLLLKKSVKSLQNRLNEFFKDLGGNFLSATASAFTRARSKLLHTAFIDLNRQAIVGVMYADEEYKKYKGFRLCAIDGSKLRLPDEQEIKEHFGVIRYTNQNPDVQGEHCYAVISVFYDLLNHIAIDSVIAPSNANELDIVPEHLKYTQSNDLLIMDRNYGCYLTLAMLKTSGRNFLIRCSRTSFACVHEMFENSEINSRIVTIHVNSRQKQKVEQLGLPTQIQIRLVRVILDTEEVEVLATSLLDEQLYPVAEFKDLYWRRWGIETFYDRIKNRLEVQHFTGKTPESVKQDFFSTIYVSGLESILTEDAQDVLDQKTDQNKHPQAVNKSVSFNVIKNHVLELLNQKCDLDTLLERLTKLFLTNPVCVRKDRETPRKPSNDRKRAYYYKHIKKHNF